MPGSSYHRVARLGTHPAFDMRAVALRCPRGCSHFDRVSDYNRHVLSHDLTQPEAWRSLDAKTYNKLAAKHGWDQA